MSAKTLSDIAKALKIEVFELFKPGEAVNLDVSGVIMHDLDDINDTIVKSIADSIEPACKNH